MPTTAEVIAAANADLEAVRARTPDWRDAKSPNEQTQLAERAAMLTRYGGALSFAASIIATSDRRIAEVEKKVAELRTIEVSGEERRAAAEEALRLDTNNPRAQEQLRGLVAGLAALRTGWNENGLAYYLGRDAPNYDAQGHEIATRREPGLLDRLRAEREQHVAKLESDAAALAALRAEVERGTKAA